MDRLKKRLFIATYKQFRLYSRMEDSWRYTSLEVMAAQSSYQTLYRFLADEGLEEEYLEWLSEQNKNC